MYIESISFSKKPINGKGWEIKECNFNKINLIAGQNSAGKTRLLNAINILINMLINDKIQFNVLFKIKSKWKISLKDKDNRYIYELEIEDNIILYEKLLINGKEYFNRDKNGKYEIEYEKAGIKIESEISKNKFVLSFKYKDRIQHSSLESLSKWVNSVYMYNFGGSLGKNSTLSNKAEDIDEDTLFARINRDDKAVVLKFEKALNKEKEFKDQIIQDFNSIGYNIEDIGTTKIDINSARIPKRIKDVISNISSLLYIKEYGIKDKIFQQDISQGMFRVLSLIIQIKYLEYELDNFSATILIDDIGEGLDYERATKLIKYIIKNSQKLEDKVQLIMTTNDRFTMNNIPLEYWIIINKENNGKINFYTKKTHQECFEDFEDVGLNNFDFFSGEYYKHCIGNE